MVMPPLLLPVALSATTVTVPLVDSIRPLPQS